VGHTIIAALGSGVGVYALVAGFIALKALVRYRLSGDPLWTPKGEQGRDRLTFEIECDADPPVDVSVLRFVDASVRVPSGEVVPVSGRHVYKNDSPPTRWFHFPREVALGPYEVCWYGTTIHRKRYEIARAAFMVEPLKDGPSPQPIRLASRRERRRAWTES
jgi:hypothetical protein